MPSKLAPVVARPEPVPSKTTGTLTMTAAVGWRAAMGHDIPHRANERHRNGKFKKPKSAQGRTSAGKNHNQGYPNPS